MSKRVFISGSMSINRLPKNAITKLDSIIEKKIYVLIGDAKGADLQVQKYLVKKNYSNVIIYYAGKDIRNNVGKWQTKHISTHIEKKSRELYTEKDKAMVKDTDYGLMIWDGKSKGTQNNILNMKNAQKKFFVILDNMLVDDSHIDSLLNISKDISIVKQPLLF